MRFMILVPTTQDLEAGRFPDERAVTRMHQYNEELAKAGVRLEAEGLQPTSRGARVIFDGAKRTAIDGPFTETKELIAGFSIIRCKSREEAVEWVKRTPMVQKDGRPVQVEIRQLFDSPTPPGATPTTPGTLRFMVMVPATRDTEAGILPTGEEVAAMMKAGEEMVKAGVILGGLGLRATSLGARVKFGAGGRPQVIDGPFAESKELIGGFWILQVGSRAEAIEWASRAPFPEGAELEIRQVFEDEDFAASDPTGELRAQDDQLRREIARNA